MDKKYQVFISSTFADLKEARKKVMDTILQLHQIPAGMEMFPASNDEQMTHIKSEIDRSDYYVLILGHRYGTTSPEGISYTEMEYDYAIEQGIPVLAFIIDENVLVRPADLDTAEGAKEKLKEFRAKAQSNRLCKYWSSPDDLATNVSTSLSRSFTDTPRTGWIRGNQVASSQVAEESMEPKLNDIYQNILRQNALKSEMMYKIKDSEVNVKIDPSNNNGKFIIGEGLNEFAIKFDVAGTGVARVMNDYGIQVSRIKNKAHLFESYQDIVFEELDFTNRLRRYESNDLAVIVNKMGKIALITFINIECESHGAYSDLIEFKWKIIR